MRVLVCYDVCTSTKAGAKRLRKIAKTCESHGIRVQFSVFECYLLEHEWIQFRQKLLKTFDEEADSLRFYFIDKASFEKKEHHGAKEPIDPTEVLIL